MPSEARIVRGDKFRRPEEIMLAVSKVHAAIDVLAQGAEPGNGVSALVCLEDALDWVMGDDNNVSGVLEMLGEFLKANGVDVAVIPMGRAAKASNN